MRIGLASLHPRALSGQVGSLVALARELEQLGDRVEIVSPIPTRDLLSGERRLAANWDRGYLASKMLKTVGVVQRIVGLSRRCDLIHLNLPTPAFGAIGDYVAARSRRPVVVGYEAECVRLGDLLAHGRLFAAPQFYLPLILLNNRLLPRLAPHLAVAYVVSSRTQREDLIAIGHPARNIVVIPNLIDVAVGTRRSREEARTLLQIPAGPAVTYLGHFNHIKGVDVLVKAMKTVVERLPDATLILAWSGLGSPGPVVQAINRCGLADHIRQVGIVEPTDLFAAADVVALPYRTSAGQSAFPEVVLEALAFGVPLVTSDLPLLREILVDHQTAVLVPPERPDLLAGQILRVLCDRSENAMRLAQRTEIRERFGSTILGQRYRSLYQAILTS